MPLSQNEVNQIVDQIIRATDNVNELLLKITREGEGSGAHQLILLKSDLISAGFLIQDIGSLPDRETVTEIYHQYEYRSERRTIFTVTATFRFTEDVLEKEPRLSAEIRNKSKVGVILKTPENQFDEVTMKSVARLISLDANNVIEISAGFHFELRSSEKNIKKFIDEIVASGLLIVGEPKVTYERGLHSNAPDINNPSHVKIQVKYNSANVDSVISKYLRNSFDSPSLSKFKHAK